MSFWSDASGSTKGIIVAGAILIIVGVIYLLMPEGERAQARGVAADQGTTQNE